ncbi:8409_t:CDS:2 [Scutellospora calospora]|uniref:8409_t:CDS:1 n=1 Tax=Scutellospora calospora TaxID=85575 RepID=A0ACA9N710_9GLOM|nr:8409_t:CDS:2 [Scutellospora calospora]
MTDDELYHALRARKIRLGVAQEIASTYAPTHVILTTLVSPVHGVTKASVKTTGLIAHSIDLSEVNDLIEVVSDLNDAIVDFCDVINDISVLCLAIMDSSDGENVLNGINQVSDVVNNFKSNDGAFADLTVTSTVAQVAVDASDKVRTSVEGFKNVTSSIDLSVLTSRFTLFTNGILKSDADTVVEVIDLVDETKDLVTDDKKGSTDLNSTNNSVKQIEPTRILVNIANFREMMENHISQYTTNKSFIPLKSENNECLTTDVTTVDNEKTIKEKSDSILDMNIQNITAAAASFNISDLSTTKSSK